MSKHDPIVEAHVRAYAVLHEKNHTAGNGASALSDDARAAVLKQVHYYFSDGNLQRDSFMRDKIAESAEGWVALDLINSFNRMRRMGLTVSDLVEVLRASDELSVDAGGGRVRRHAPFP